MLIITSPAKTLDFERPFHSPHTTKPLFPEKTAILIAALQKYPAKKIKRLMSISDKLAHLNYDRFQHWETHSSRPAIFAYKGDIYREMHPAQYSTKQLDYLQQSLRIISGLYGLVRPFDLIKPYRLEMKIAVRTKKAKNLYGFWGETLTEELNAEIKKESHSHLINLASQEYFTAIQFKKITAPVITIEFRQQKGAKINNFGLLSKRARGMMIDYMTMHGVKTIDQLKKFNAHGYSFMKEEKDKLFFLTKI